MSINIKGKIAIVTGASRGIGEGIAKVFSTEGATVICAARSTVDGDRVVKSINEKGGSAIFIQADIRLEADCKRLINTVVEKYGRLDIMCHNAGIYPDELMEDMSIETWDNTINTNLRSCFLLTKPCVKVMRAQKSGRILFTSSITGPNVAQARLAAYSSSKGALNILTEVLAEEYAESGPKFNSLSLGSVNTPMLKEAFPGYSAKVNPDEMASFIFNFANTASSIFNGKVIPVSSTNP